MIIRFSSIGDIVLTTPVIRALRKQLNAEIHYLTKPAFQAILSSNPYVERVFPLQKKIRDTITLLSAQKYDLVVDLHKNLRSQRIKWALGVPSVSFDKLNRQKWLLVNFKWNVLPPLHIVDRYLDELKPYGVGYDGQGLDYFIAPEDEIDVAVLADRYFSHQEKARAALADQQFVALVVGAAHATKRMLPEQLVAVASQIKVPVVLLGGPDDEAVGDLVAKQAGPSVINLCGKYSLGGSASIIRQAAVVVSHDTGLMHIAAAFNRPIVSIWGNTIPALGMYPFYPADKNRGVIMEVEGLACRPCSKIGFETCPKGHFKCMKEQSIPKIVAQVHEKLLNAF